MKILLPVDGSPSTHRVLEFIVKHPELLGPGNDYVALTCVNRLPAHASSFLQHDVIERYYGEEADKVLAPVRDFAQKAGLRLTTRQATGQPAELVAQVAEEEQFELVVMASHGHSALAAVLLGSVTSGVLARCKVPVLIVR